MMDSPEARAATPVAWLVGRQGLGLLLLITLLAATFLATDVTFLAGALLLCGLAARVWAALAFAHVGYSRRTSRSRAFCGDALELESSLANPRLLPLPWIEVWEHLPFNLGPEGPNERSFTDPERVWVSRGLALWPYQRVRWRRRLLCHRRGVFRLGQARLRSGDPFGFFEREQLWDDRLELLVYPRVVPLRRLALSLHHPSLDVVSPSSPVADPTRTATVRDYRPDDARRMIHWPTTARRGSLQVRVLEPATSLHVSLLLDVRSFTSCTSDLHYFCCVVGVGLDRRIPAGPGRTHRVPDQHRLAAGCATGRQRAAPAKCAGKHGPSCAAARRGGLALGLRRPTAREHGRPGHVRCGCRPGADHRPARGWWFSCVAAARHG